MRLVPTFGRPQPGADESKLEPRSGSTPEAGHLPSADAVQTKPSLGRRLLHTVRSLVGDSAKPAPSAPTPQHEAQQEWPLDQGVTGHIMRNLGPEDFAQARVAAKVFAKAGQDPALPGRQALLKQAVDAAQSPDAIIQILQKAVGTGDLAKVERLSLAHRGFNAAQVGQLCAILEEAGHHSPNGLALRHLNLADNPIGDAGVEWLAQAKHLAPLNELNLSDADVNEAGAEALAGAHHLTALTHLDLGGSRLQLAGARAIAGAQHLRTLEHLNLARAALGVGGAEAIVLAQQFKSLRYLSFQCCYTGNALAQAVAEAKHLSLHTLILLDNSIDHEGARALAGARHLSSLQDLTIGHNPLGDAGVEALARSPYFRQLKHLELMTTPSRGRGRRSARKSWPIQISGVSEFRRQQHRRRGSAGYSSIPAVLVA